MEMTCRRAGVLLLLVVCASACGRSRASNAPAASTANAAPAATSSASAPKGPIDVCGIVTAEKATAILGSLGPQPPVKTDHAGFGTDMCMYLGPAVSGEGAQTVFLRLTVQAATGKDGPDLLQYDAEKKKATVDVSGVGSSAKRNQAGTFVWATSGAIACTAEISNGLPNGLAADTAGAKLAGLCRDIFAAAH